MTTTITARQKAILDFIQTSLEEHGYPPSVREIASHFRFSGTRAAEKHIEALVKKGALRKGTGARTLQLPGRAYARTVPIVGQVAAGRPILAEENFIGELTIDPSLARTPDTFLLKVKGQSMRDAGILDGDLVLVRPQPDADTQDIVVAMIDGEATVKRLIKQPASGEARPFDKGRPGEIVLQPENTDFQPIVVKEGNDLGLIGKVVGVFRV